MKSALFLMEQLIVILIFAVCAAICVKIIADSSIIAKESRDLNNALSIAESGAEAYKYACGDTEKLASALGGGVSGNDVYVYYNKNWQVCEKDNAHYFMSIVNSGVFKSLCLADVSVKKIGGEEVFALNVAVRGKRNE